VRVRVITISDRTHAGVYEDVSGPVLMALLAPLGEVEGPRVVPDEIALIAREVTAAVADGVDLLVTTGGTGISPRDVTPEAVRPLLERELPGVPEAMRALGNQHVPTAALSRSVAGTIGRTFVVTLPGSSGGVRDGAAVLLPLAAHVHDQLRGGDHS
jgi:molybdenum cofactor synthesis domain-containing protein